MEEQSPFIWEDSLVETKFTVQDSALWPADNVDGASLVHSGDSQSNPDESKNNQEATARQRSRRTSGSDEEPKKFSGPRRLRWHVSYGKSTTKSGSPRAASQDQSSDEYDGMERSKRQRKDWRSVKQHSERADPVTAAKNKASRERQRRERLNDSFVDLSMALDPERSLKAEKTTVIADTIKVLGNIRSENGHLRHEKEQLQEHITHVERRNKELLFEQDLLKRELDNARLHNYNVQQHPSAPSAYQGHLDSGMQGAQVVLGVPVHSSAAPVLSVAPEDLGSVPDLMKGLDHKSMSIQPHRHLQLSRHDLHRASLPSFRQSVLHGSDDSPVSESQAIMLGSPSDFFDLDLPMTEALTDLGKGTTELGLFPPLNWLPPGEGHGISEHVTNAL